MNAIITKKSLCTAAGLIGGYITTLFGGWTTAMTTLLICMAIDYLSGLAVAGVFKKSPKTDSGALESRTGWKGLCRKGMTLLIVLIAHRLDVEFGTSYLKDTTCIGFILNELISITENAGLMGLPLPSVLTKAIDVLKNKSEGDE